jgi:hypothetical protein
MWKFAIHLIFDFSSFFSNEIINLFLFIVLVLTKLRKGNSNSCRMSKYLFRIYSYVTSKKMMIVKTYKYLHHKYFRTWWSWTPWWWRPASPAAVQRCSTGSWPCPRGRGSPGQQCQILALFRRAILWPVSELSDCNLLCVHTCIEYEEIYLLVDTILIYW